MVSNRLGLNVPAFSLNDFLYTPIALSFLSVWYRSTRLAVYYQRCTWIDVSIVGYNWVCLSCSHRFIAVWMVLYVLPI